MADRGTPNPDPELDAMVKAAKPVVYPDERDTSDGSWSRIAIAMRDALDAYRAEQEAVWAEGVRAIADAESNSILEGYAAAVDPTDPPKPPIYSDAWWAGEPVEPDPDEVWLSDLANRPSIVVEAAALTDSLLADLAAVDPSPPEPDPEPEYATVEWHEWNTRRLTAVGQPSPPEPWKLDVEVALAWHHYEGDPPGTRNGLTNPYAGMPLVKVPAEPDWENATSYSDLATGTITPTDPDPYNTTALDEAAAEGWENGQDCALASRVQVGWYSPKTGECQKIGYLSHENAPRFGLVPVFIDSVESDLDASTGRRHHVAQKSAGPEQETP